MVTRGAVACVTALGAVGSVVPSRRRQHGAVAVKGLPRAPSRVQVRATISSNDFRPGVTIEIDQAPYKVVEFLHVKPGKGAAFVRTKLRNYLTGNTVEKTFRAGETVPTAQIEKSTQQYTYPEGDVMVFMNTETFEETRVDVKQLQDEAPYIKEGAEISMLQWNEKIIGVELPKNVVLEVVECDPGVKGNTATNATKPAKLETGYTVQVPLFINTNDKIMIDTTEGKYLKRAND